MWLLSSSIIGYRVNGWSISVRGLCSLAPYSLAWPDVCTVIGRPHFFRQ